MDENTGVTWHQGATFVASDANAEKSFGPALANSGNALVVGSPGSPSPDPFHPIPVMRSDSGTPANSLDANAERDLVSTWPAGFQSGFTVPIQAIVSTFGPFRQLTNAIAVTRP